MTFKEYSKLLKSLSEKDIGALAKLEVVSAVENNIDLQGYDSEGFEKLCDTIYEYVSNIGCYVDVDDLCYAIQYQLDNGKCDTIDTESLDKAFMLTADMNQIKR